MSIKMLYILFFSLLLFSSCETNQRTERTSREAQSATGQLGGVAEISDAEYTSRRIQAMTFIDNQFNKLRNERDSLRFQINNVSGEGNTQIEERLEVLEIRMAQLQDHHQRLAQDGKEGLIIVETDLYRILIEGVESQEMDRSVRGEGTSLDGPDLNSSGTRTGTEIEKRQQNIETDVERDLQRPVSE
ncbi:MAG: hypothetical protein M3512_03920 [Bacteroidota bacterium]|nr:hypothetical protein [Bacteroidota bacterium]